MPAALPTDRQVRADVYKITRVYLEVERGLRPPDQLEKFLTEAEYRRHRKTPHHPASRSREAVLPTDVGRIHLDRHLHGQVTATVPTRESGDRWGALVLHFARDHTGRWRVDQLERLTRRSVVRQPSRPVVEPKDLDVRIRDVETERRVVDAAHRAATTRLRELRHANVDKDQQREVRQQQQTWKRRRSELDDELTHLRTTRELRARLADIDHRPQQPATALTDAHLERLLGPVPDDDWQQRLRDGLIEEIHTYRRRWNVTDARNVLGPDPAHPDQRRDRDDLADTLRAAARALGTSPEPPGSGTSTRCRHQHDQARGVAAER
jgi:hypothetical protein